MGDRRPSARPKRTRRSLSSTAFLALAASFALTDITETAVANGDTRTLTLYHQSTKETLVATFRNNGSYDQAVLDKLNWFLRDWRRDEPTRMDPRLFDVVWEVYRSAGVVDQQITVYSAYRSPETNAMLRRRSRQVAERSQHMLGKAMDSTMPNVSIERLREIGMRMQRGGVGYYSSANFVHLDVGSVRSWPRMNYDQLARLFPDGKTVHIPANGQPMARYEEARAEIEARNDGAYAPPSQSKGLFAWLFGPKDEEGDEEESAMAAVPRRGRGQAIAAARQAPAVAAAPQPSLAVRTVAVSDTELATGGASLSVAETPPPAEQPVFAGTDPASVAAIPLPPRRPVGLMAAIDVPLPPARPLTSFVAIGPAKPPGDPIGKLIATNAPASVQPAALPGVITSGTSERRAGSGPAVLAYAADSSKSIAQPAGANVGFRPAESGLVPARLDRSNFRTLTAAASTAMTKTHAVLGPAVTGLRQAINAVGGAFAAAPTAGYLSRFESRASAPDATRFSGAAIQKLPTDTLMASSVAPPPEK